MMLSSRILNEGGGGKGDQIPHFPQKESNTYVFLVGWVRGGGRVKSRNIPPNLQSGSQYGLNLFNQH